MVISDVTRFLEMRGWGGLSLVVVSRDAWTWWSFLGSWFLETHGQGGLPWLWFLGMRGWGGLSFGCGFWRRVNVVVFSLWFLGMRGRGGLSLDCDFWRHVNVVVFLGPWFLGMRGWGGFSFGRGSWRCVDVVVFLWAVVPVDVWTGWSFLGSW